MPRARWALVPRPIERAGDGVPPRFAIRLVFNRHAVFHHAVFAGEDGDLRVGDTVIASRTPEAKPLGGQAD